MNANTFISTDTFTKLMTSIIDLENSNLPLDYFTSVLPRAQYGDESAVPIGMKDSPASLIVKDSADPSVGAAYRDWETDRKSTRLNSSHSAKSRMPSSA